MVVAEKLKSYLQEIEKNDKKGKMLNSFIYLNPFAMQQAKEIDEKIKRGTAGKLAGTIVAVKSNINVYGLKVSCASKTLENYNGSFDATVIKKIKEEDGLIIGMTNMDEFACGGSGETSAYGPAKNPVNTNLIPGGSSSGSAVAVAGGFCDMALGSDTGGSIRNPASHCGIVGVKPSYSRVSRYGLIDLSMSLDQIGPFAKNVKDVATLLSVIEGKDEKDSISQEIKKINLNEVETTPKNIVVGLLDFPIQDKRISKFIEDSVEKISKKYNWKVEKIKMENMDLAIETYYLLVYVEFFSATRRFDGRRYGKKIEDFAGPEVLRRIFGGSEISKAEHQGRYYHTALRAKALFEEEFSKVFKKVDCLVMPTVPRLPHKIGSKISVEEMYSYDVLTTPPNIAGNCAISIPCGRIEGIPIGMQIVCDRFNDEKMLQIARSFEKVIQFS